MAGLIRRVVLGAGLVGAAGAGWLAWRWAGSAVTETDLAYGEDPAQRLDIYLPEGDGPFPCVVEIHGGALRGGDKAEREVSDEVLAAGIAVVRINYRLPPAAVWPAQAEDCLAAVVFLQRNGRDHGLDPSRLALWGWSAGATLAVGTALTLVEAGLPPRAVVSFFGPMDFSTLDADMTAMGRVPAFGPADAGGSAESRFLGFAIGEARAAAREISPIARLERLEEPLPPIFIRHGDADQVVADLQASRLRDAWIKADPAAAVDFALVPGAGHGGGGFDTDAVIAPMVSFLQNALG